MAALSCQSPLHTIKTSGHLLKYRDAETAAFYSHAALTNTHTHTHPWQELQEARAPSKISLITIRKHLINQAWLTKVHARPPCPRHEGEDSFNFLTKAVWAPHTGHLATCHLFSMILKRQWIGIQIMHKSFLKIPGQLQRQRKMCDMQPHWVPGWTDSLFEVIIHFFLFIYFIFL